MDRLSGTIKTLLLDRYHRVLAAPHDPEWDDRATFIDWCIMRGFEPGMCLIRKDTTLPFGPQNCEVSYTRQSAAQEAPDAEWKRLWNETVNRFRRAAGLPLFPE